MTISLAGATGVSTTAAARGTSSTTVAYTAVAAGRLAVITAVVKPSTATWGSDPAGWTKITDATGGTGTNAADTGTSRVGKWYRILDGSESGSVTITSANSPSATAACMDVYSKTLGSWATPISVTGADTTHGTNPTAASGTWSDSLQGGDVVHVGYATDTDSTTATTGQAISQSGTTFGTVTARSRVGNSSGNQNSVFTWDATVTGVTAGASTGVGATTMTLTWSASSCGAFGALRLREYDNMSAVSDNFDDGTQNPKVYGPDSYGTFSETGGRMRLDVSTTYAGVYSPNDYRFDDVYFRAYPAAANGAATEAYSAFWLDAQDQAAGTMLGFFYESINDQLYLASWVGYSDASQVVLNSAAANFPYWRLQRSGSNVLWQTSPDGSTWTTQRTAAMPTWLANGTALAMWWECHRADGTANNYEVDNLNVVSAISYTRTVDDSAGLADAVATASVLARAVTDDAALTDANSTASTFARAVADAAELADSVSTQIAVAHARTIDDPAGLSDTASSAAGFGVALTDSSGLVDTAAAASAFTRAQTDVAGLADAATAATAFGRVLTDAAGLADTIQAAGALARTVDDGAGFIDSVATASAFARVLTDDAGLSDVASPQLAGATTRTVDDGMGLADVVALARTATVSDSAGIVDQLAVAAAATVADSTGLSDAVTSQLASGFSRTVDDSLGLADALAKAQTATADDLAGLSDNLTQARTASVADSTGLADSASVQLAGVGSRQADDSVGLTDAVSVSAALARTDSLGLVDAATLAMAAARTASDALGITDALVVAVTRTVALTESTGLTDSTSVNVATGGALTRTITDSVGLASSIRLVQVTRRPVAGITIRPDLGMTPRPNSGITERPDLGVTPFVPHL